MFGRELNKLYCSDSYATTDLDLVISSPATSFFCISQLGTLHAPETIAFHAKETQNFALSLIIDELLLVMMN